MATLQEQLIRAIRRDGRSHNELARVAKLPQPTVTRIVNGDREPRASTIDALVKALGYRVELRKKSIKV